MDNQHEIQELVQSMDAIKGLVQGAKAKIRSSAKKTKKAKAPKKAAATVKPKKKTKKPKA